MATEKQHLIDIDACGRYVAGRMGFNPKSAEDVMGYLADFADKHTVDAVEVVHGRWLLERTPDEKPYCFHCSVCDDDFSYIGTTTAHKYCPNCGAKMDGDGNA